MESEFKTSAIHLGPEGPSFLASEDKKNGWLFISHIEWVIVFITLLGGFYSIDAGIDAINARFDQFMIAWHEEAKDFHGRLERLDADFKNQLTNHQ